MTSIRYIRPEAQKSIAAIRRSAAKTAIYMLLPTLSRR
jgi:hypothetical protein